MDRNVLERTLKIFEAVDKDELFGALEQYDVNQAFTSENIERILMDVAHKELFQKPMFIADSFKVLNATPLVQEYLSAFVLEAWTNSQKSTQCHKISRGDVIWWKVSSQYLNGLVREMYVPKTCIFAALLRRGLIFTGNYICDGT